MNITDRQVEEFEEACRPLVKWLNENCHPMVQAIVDCNGAELVEGLCTAEITEFQKD